jgi:hypothetical protein
MNYEDQVAIGTNLNAAIQQTLRGISGRGRRTGWRSASRSLSSSCSRTARSCRLSDSTEMNQVEAKATASGHVLVTIKTGEIVQAQANLDLSQASALQKQIEIAIAKLAVLGR